MGLFGNKDNKESKDSTPPKELAPVELKPIEANKNQVVSSQAVPAINIFDELSSKYCAIYKGWKKQSSEWLDPHLNEVKEWRKEFVGDFCRPIANIYRSVPENLTDFKYKTFGRYSFKERLFGLEGVTLLVALYTFNRKKADFGAVNRLLYSTRNAAVSYLLGGLLIAPEIYNPLIKE